MSFEPFGKDAASFRAVVYGRVDELRGLSSEELRASFDLDEDYGMGFERLSLLMVAAGSPASNLETVRLLLEGGSDLAQRSRANGSATWYAASGIPLPLLDKSLPRDGDGDWWLTPGDVHRLRFLLDVGGDPNEPGWFGRCVLAEAARGGNAESVALLLERGADPKGSGETHRLGAVTPIEMAVQSDSTACVQLLLDAGIDLRASSILTSAMSPEMARFLIEHGAPVSASGDWCGEDLLDTLLGEEPRIEVARVLLEAGCPLEGSNWGAGRAHSLAGTQMHPDALKLVVEFGARTDVPGWSGGTLLHTAAWQGDGNRGRPTEHVRETMEYLIGLGIPLDQVDNEGMTALHEAVGGYWESPTATEVLLRHGANPNIRDRRGQTPLMIAAGNSLECVKLLLRYGADPKVRKGLTTALSIAKDNLKSKRGMAKRHASGKPLFGAEFKAQMEAVGAEFDFSIDNDWVESALDSIKLDYPEMIAEAEEIVRLLESA